MDTDTESEIRSKLSPLWTRILEIKNVCPDENFFVLGGDSLRAAILFTEIEAVFGVTLPLETIYDEAETFAGMAALIEKSVLSSGNESDRRASSNKASILVPVSKNQTGQPIFAVPGIGGHAIDYAHLAHELGDEFSIYGFQSRGLDGNRDPDQCIDEIARLNIAELRDTQPESPYYLFGSCFGAIVAYEMAQQLKGDGKEVALLAMLDPPGNSLTSIGDRRPRYRMPSKYPKSRFIADRVRLYFQELIDLDGPGRVKFFKEKLLIAKQSFAQRDMFRGDRTELHQARVIESNFAALQSYLPEPYAGPAVILISMEREIFGTEDLRLKWLELIAEGGRVRNVPGKDSGFSLKPPDVETLGQILKAEILCSTTVE